MNVRDAMALHIAKWEGLFQNFAWDPGNYVTMPSGQQRLVGTMRGVTPAVLAAHRGVPAHTLTADDMRTVTLAEAADIAVTRFYQGTGLDLLAWGPATDVLVDIAWGSGPRQAIRFAQRLAGVTDDGVVGPLTVAAYNRWVAGIGWEAAVRELHRVRMAFYLELGRQNPAKFGPPQPGWKNRADSMLPRTEWWARWQPLPPLPVAPEAVPPARPVEYALPTPSSEPGRPVADGTAIAGSAGAGTLAQLASAAQQVQSSLFGVPLELVKWVFVGAAAVLAAYAVWRFIKRPKQVTASG